MKLRLISEGEHKDAFGTHKWKTYAQIPTNADRLRAMTDEELARFVTREDLCELTCNSSIPCDGRCEAKMLDWLKQEAQCTSE